MMSFVKSSIEWWRENRNTPVTFKNTLIYTALIAAIAFGGGRLYPESDYQRLRDNIAQLRDQISIFSAQRDRNQREIIKLRASTALNKKMLQHLRAQNAELEAEKIRHREETIFYQQALSGKPKTEIAIYALEETPDFRPRHRRLSAVLVRAQAKKNFHGTYYFEVIEAGAQGTSRVTRVPAQESVKLTVDVYKEIEQIFKLPPDTDIRKLRLVVKGKKGNIVAEEIMEQNRLDSTVL